MFGWLSDSFGELKTLLGRHNQNITDVLENTLPEEVLYGAYRSFNNFTETMKDFNRTLITNAREARIKKEDRKRHTGKLTDIVTKKSKSGDREPGTQPQS